MLGGADNPNGELPSYITGADSRTRFFQTLTKDFSMGFSLVHKSPHHQELRES